MEVCVERHFAGRLGEECHGLTPWLQSHLPAAFKVFGWWSWCYCTISRTYICEGSVHHVWNTAIQLVGLRTLQLASHCCRRASRPQFLSLSNLSKCSISQNALHVQLTQHHQKLWGPNTESPSRSSEVPAKHGWCFIRCLPNTCMFKTWPSKSAERLLSIQLSILFAYVLDRRENCWVHSCPPSVWSALAKPPGGLRLFGRTLRQVGGYRLQKKRDEQNPVEVCLVCFISWCRHEAHHVHKMCEVGKTKTVLPNW